MARKLFGTDGIRGIAGEPPLDPRTAYAVGVALGRWAKQAAGGEVGETPEIVIGMDTRESGPWLAAQVAGGLDRSGVATRFAGVTTTPGIAYLARTGPYLAGVMISASHNPYHDNGIKIIDSSGYKLADSIEEEIEHVMFAWMDEGQPPSPAPLAVDEALNPLYEEFLAGTVSSKLPFQMVVDCANGSATAVAPALLSQLGVCAELIGNAPDGRNINLNCGSLHLDSLREKVLAEKAQLGVAFDGDADRALFVSGSGKIIDGDAILFLLASALKEKERLPDHRVVATVMSNLGFERALAAHAIQLERTPVGDKYVLEKMLQSGAALGGEQSGHIILSDYATTGDGLLTALQVLQVLADSKKDLDDLTGEIKVFPQKLENIRVKVRRPLADMPATQKEIREAEESLGTSGRVLVRFSGTEPLVRVMVEAESEEQVEVCTSRIAAAVRNDLGASE